MRQTPSPSHQSVVMSTIIQKPQKSLRFIQFLYKVQSVRPGFDGSRRDVAILWTRPSRSNRTLTYTAADVKTVATSARFAHKKIRRLRLCVGVDGRNPPLKETMSGPILPMHFAFAYGNRAASVKFRNKPFRSWRYAPDASATRS